MSVQVLCPNGRRVTVKLSPNTPLLHALEQACAKQGYDPSRHILKQGRNKIDVSSPFRFSGLTNNAKLELVESEDQPKNKSQDVELMLQTIDGQRLKGTFPSSTLLWDILKYHNVQDTSISVVYMRLQISGERNLREKTLKDLGIIEGRAIIRIVPLTPCTSSDELSMTNPLENKQEKEVQDKDSSTTELLSKDDTNTLQSDKQQLPEVKLSTPESVPTQMIQEEVTCGNTTKKENEKREDTSVEEYSCKDMVFPVIPISIFPEDVPINRDQPIAHYDQPLEEPNETTHTVTSTGSVLMEEEEPMEIDFQKMLEEAREEAKLRDGNHQIIDSKTTNKRTYQEPCFRNPIIYHLNSITAMPTTEIPDEFFQVTVNDVIMMQQDLKRQVQSLTDAPLETQSMREQSAVSPSSSPGYIQTVIRVLLPDQWVIQGCFNSGESIKSLVSFVREHLNDPKLKFHLYTTPPKQILKSGRPSFNEAGFVPAANIHLGFDEEAPLINGTIVSTESMRLYCYTAMEAEIAAHKNRVDSSGGGVQKTDSGRGQNYRAMSDNSRQSHEDFRGGGQRDGSGQKLPKWLKLGHNK